MLCCVDMLIIQYAAAVLYFNIKNIQNSHKKKFILEKEKSDDEVCHNNNIVMVLLWKLESLHIASQHRIQVKICCFYIAACRYNFYVYRSTKLYYDLIILSSHHETLYYYIFISNPICRFWVTRLLAFCIYYNMRFYIISTKYLRICVLLLWYKLERAN